MEIKKELDSLQKKKPGSLTWERYFFWVFAVMWCCVGALRAIYGYPAFLIGEAFLLAAWTVSSGEWAYHARQETILNRKILNLMDAVIAQNHTLLKALLFKNRRN